MMLVLAFLVSGLSLMIWIVLLVARGGFWRAVPRALPPEAARRPRPAGRPSSRSCRRATSRRDRPAATSLLEQDYPGDFHLIIVDDQRRRQPTRPRGRARDQPRRPADGAGREAAAGRLVGQGGRSRRGSPRCDARPAGRLLLTDADIGHPPDAVAQLVTRAQAENRDLVSLMVRLRCDSFWERR